MINKVHLGDWTTNQLEDKSVQLIIADPPYFEVKGEFDFVWNSFDDYLKDVEKWAIECKRVLANNGTLFWYGDKKKIAYSQIIFDKYFNLENSLVWRKKDSMQYQYYSPDLARSFNTHNERILMYSNKNVEKKFYYKNEDFIFIPLIDYISKGRKINIKELSKKTKIKETTLSHFFSKSPDGFRLANEDFFYKMNPDLDYKYYVNLYNKLNNIYSVVGGGDTVSIINTLGIFNSFNFDTSFPILSSMLVTIP